MQTATVIVTIAPDGSLKTEVQGVQGESCQTLTKPLETLGETQTELKPEFYATAAVDLTIRVGG
jgi:hypothetical protein